MKKILGIELGSTRIKAVLCDESGKVLASGSYEWENSLVDGLWSYSPEQAKEGLRESYKQLAENYGKPIERLDAIGVSAMMHGYLAFDKNGKLLAPFRTWRNTNTGKAAEELSKLFNFNVPMRWSVSQYYQSFSDGLDHVKDIDFLTTLAGYIHYLLTGKKVLGADDASGMFPLDGRDYDKVMLEKFNALIGKDFKELLPKVLLAGEDAGTLTEEGARLLDSAGTLKAGAVFCPPEGDMGTGMVCANAVKPRTGQVSSGTSANLTVILEKPLKNYYPEIDVIATPDGAPNFGGYAKTLQYGNYAILKNYGVTILYLVGNVIFGFVINVIGGYVLCRKTKLGTFFTIFILITMLFNGGTIPTYMVIRDLGLLNNPQSLILPSCTNAMFVILGLNAFKSVPESTIESAKLDGAGHFRIMFRIMLPQAIGLFIVSMINTAIISWNAWFEASIYITSARDLWPLQLWIKELQADIGDLSVVQNPDWDYNLATYCVIIISMIPVLIAMPFVQKQLQKGSLAGAVKE